MGLLFSLGKFLMKKSRKIEKIQRRWQKIKKNFQIIKI
jgi:hypothetical protein